MRLLARGVLGTLLGVGIALATSVSAAAQTTGAETFSGTIVASGVSGTRAVVASPRARLRLSRLAPNRRSSVPRADCQNSAGTLRGRLRWCTGVVSLWDDEPVPVQAPSDL